MGPKDERRFLHDLSTPLSTVFFLLDMALERLSSDSEKHADEIKMIEGAVRSMQTARDLMQKRREILIAEEDSATES